MVALATAARARGIPWSLPRCSTGTGWANPVAEACPADNRATRWDGRAVLMAGFTFEVWLRRTPGHRP